MNTSRNNYEDADVRNKGQWEHIELLRGWLVGGGADAASLALTNCITMAAFVRPTQAATQYVLKKARHRATMMAMS